MAKTSLQLSLVDRKTQILHNIFSLSFYLINMNDNKFIKFPISKLILKNLN